MTNRSKPVLPPSSRLTTEELSALEKSSLRAQDAFLQDFTLLASPGWLVEST